MPIHMMPTKKYIRIGRKDSGKIYQIVNPIRHEKNTMPKNSVIVDDGQMRFPLVFPMKIAVGRLYGSNDKENWMEIDGAILYLPDYYDSPTSPA